MKLSVIYGADWQQRTRLPNEEAPDIYKPPRFRPEHDYEYTRLFESKLRKGHKPDEIWIGSWGYHVGYYRNTHRAAKPWKSNAKVKEPRVMTPEDVEKIHAIDVEITQLMKLRRVALRNAAKRARPLTVDDCVNGTSEAE